MLVRKGWRLGEQQLPYHQDNRRHTRWSSMLTGHQCGGGRAKHYVHMRMPLGAAGMAVEERVGCSLGRQMVARSRRAPEAWRRDLVLRI